MNFFFYQKTLLFVIKAPFIKVLSAERRTITHVISKAYIFQYLKRFFALFQAQLETT